MGVTSKRDEAEIMEKFDEIYRPLLAVAPYESSPETKHLTDQLLPKDSWVAVKELKLSYHNGYI